MSEHTEIKVGDKFPNLPEEYYTGIGEHPPGLACLIVDDSAHEGLVAFIKAGIMIAVRHLRDLPAESPSDDEFDAIIMHPDDVPEKALEQAIKSAQKKLN